MIGILGLTVARAAPPRPVEVPPITGTVTRQIDGLDGLRVVVGPDGTQVVSWGPVDGSLVDDARRELDLLRQSARIDSSDPFEGALVAGRPGIRWESRAGSTLFVATVFDCPRARVEVVTGGNAPDRVRELHLAALTGTVCVEQSAGT